MSICIGCLTEIPDEVITYPCTVCVSDYCSPCMKKLFLDACVDMSLMPPRCCDPFNIGIAAVVLTEAELKVFRSRFEEQKTLNPRYCPSPTCSVFIPHRVFAQAEEAHRKKEQEPKHKTEEQNPSKTSRTQPELVPSTSQQPGQKEPESIPSNAQQVPSQRELNESQLEPASSIAQQPEHTPTSCSTTQATIRCQDCAIEICCGCKFQAHPGAQCSSTEPNPELAALLEQWKIKRCPRCGTGIRKMYGCSAMACRCGANFCYVCLRPSLVCQGTLCVEPDRIEYDVEDLDASGEDEDEALEGDFGEDPADIREINNWQCARDGHELAGMDRPKEKLNFQYRCQNCWCEVAEETCEKTPMIRKGFACKFCKQLVCDECSGKGTARINASLPLNIPIPAA
ncbi:hypothetical protein FQN57_004789 [Myotisia sp. PD_48]|nr:hypothetical protein FQN57_004789 [Myotisia sp. PD_48]